MTNLTNPIDVRAYASSVMTALTDLQEYLSASVNPDRIALDELHLEPMGWTKHVYTEKAFDIWGKQLEQFPNDPTILHHMAIMHHARAFDLEAGAKPSESDADWKAAMDFWHRLHAMDAFWDNLTEKACKGTVRQDAIKKLRADFPQMILAVHYDIALDKETRNNRKSRAKFHIAIVHNAPFDAHQRAQAQRAAYNLFIQSFPVPDEVWQSNELREDILSEGQKAIVEYLNFDPECVPALKDALRLQRRVQISRNTTWQALNEDDPRRKELLLSEKRDAEAWLPFFNQLAATSNELEGDVREDLLRWYQGRAQDMLMLELFEEAIGFYEQALVLFRSDDDDRRACQRNLVETMARWAFTKAREGVSGAKAYCDKVRSRDDLTVQACFWLVPAYAQLSLRDVAVDICDRGLAIEPDFDDRQADECIKQLIEFKQQLSH